MVTTKAEIGPIQIRKTRRFWSPNDMEPTEVPQLLTIATSTEDTRAKPCTFFTLSRPEKIVPIHGPVEVQIPHVILQVADCRIIIIRKYHRHPGRQERKGED